MRTFVIVIAILLAGCDRIPDGSGLVGTYLGKDRDGLCLDAPLGRPDLSLHLATYDAGDSRCFLSDASAHVDIKHHEIDISIDHNSYCKFIAEFDGQTITIPQILPSSCAQYCSGGASLEGRTFTCSSPATKEPLHGAVLDPYGRSVC